VSYNKVGDAFAAQDKLDDALRVYRDGLEVALRLAAANPDNGHWWRSVSVSHVKLASVYLRLSNTAGALTELRKGREIAAMLVARAPENAQWKQDLALFEQEIARLEATQKN
jgi:hypothetical protein